MVCGTLNSVQSPIMKCTSPSMNTRASPIRLSTLCEDVVFRLASFLTLDDLLSLSMSCRHIYRALLCSSIWGHWLNILPPAIIITSHQPSHDKTVRAAIRHSLRLRSIWSGNSDTIHISQVCIRAERWCFRIDGSPWMFNYVKSSGITTIQCINLISDEVIGAMTLTSEIHSSSAFNGQQLPQNQVLIATLCEERVSKKNTWSVEVVTTSFSENGGNAIFTHQKSVLIPEELSSLFTRFDVLQVDGDYIVLSGNWSTKSFLLMDWKRETITVYCSSDYWRIFHWKLLGTKLFIVHDDGKLDVIDVSLQLSPETQGSFIKHSHQVITLPNYRKIRFIQHSSSEFSILLAAQANGGTIVMPGAPSIWHSRMSLHADGTATFCRGHFDGLLFSLDSSIHIGASGILSRGEHGELSIWSMGKDGSLCQAHLNPPQPHDQTELLDVDLEIGMIVMKHASYEPLRASYVNVYWVL